MLDHELELMKSTRYTPVGWYSHRKDRERDWHDTGLQTKPRTLGSSVQELAKENSKLGQGTGGGLDFNKS